MLQNNQAYNLNELLNAPIENHAELVVQYDSRKSFYGKAKVFFLNNGTKLLQSYNTFVALVLPNGKFLSNGRYSATTARHEIEFAKQFSNDYDGNLSEYVLGKKFNF